MAPNGPRILIVDDDNDTLNLLKLVLQRDGYRTVTAIAWEDVLEQVRKADEERDQFNLVILDIMMPSRSGFDVYLTLQVMLHPMPPVIFLSAKCNIDDMVKASDLGAAKYLTKPTTPDKLLKAVKEVLAQKAH